jgi:hypothetical protein
VLLPLHQNNLLEPGGGDVNVDITGAEIAAQAGTVTATTDVNVTLTGAEISADPGTATVTADQIISVTGAAIAGEAGTPDAQAIERALSPLGLPVRDYGFKKATLASTVIGAQVNAEAGVVSAEGTEGGIRVEIGPLGLVNKPRQFSPKQTAQVNVSASISGAEIRGEFSEPDGSHTTIYADGKSGAAEAGLVTSSTAFLIGAAIAGEAGTVTAEPLSDVSITGAEISGDAGEVFGAPGISAPVSGAEISVDAGTVTPNVDVNVNVTGGQIQFLASEVGVDTPVDLSAIVTGAEISADAGTAASSNTNVVISGTILPSVQAKDIQDGGKTIIITLENDTWLAGGVLFDAVRQDILDGITTDASHGRWLQYGIGAQPVSAVVRTSDTVVTITLVAAPDYEIRGTETITVKVPNAALVSHPGDIGEPGDTGVLGSPTFSVSHIRAGRGKKRRYVVEVDNQLFEVATQKDAIALLTQVRELAQEVASEATGPVSAPTMRVVTATGKVSQSKAIQKAVRDTKRKIRLINQRANERIRRDNEIAELLHLKLEQEDEEDTILALLLS